MKLSDVECRKPTRATIVQHIGKNKQADVDKIDVRKKMSRQSLSFFCFNPHYFLIVLYLLSRIRKGALCGLERARPVELHVDGRVRGLPRAHG
jgi:hypothetical protein